MWWDLWSTFKKVLKFPNLCCLPEPKSLSPHIQTCRTWKYLRFLISSFQTCGLEAVFFSKQSCIKCFHFCAKKRTFCVDSPLCCQFYKEIRATVWLFKHVQEYSINPFASNFIIKFFQEPPFTFRIFFSHFYAVNLVHLLEGWTFNFSLKILFRFLFWIYFWEKWCFPFSIFKIYVYLR